MSVGILLLAMALISFATTFVLMDFEEKQARNIAKAAMIIGALSLIAASYKIFS